MQWPAEQSSCFNKTVDKTSDTSHAILGTTLLALTTGLKLEILSQSTQARLTLPCDPFDLNRRVPELELDYADGNLDECRLPNCARAFGPLNAQV